MWSPWNNLDTGEVFDKCLTSFLRVSLHRDDFDSWYGCHYNFTQVTLQPPDLGGILFCWHCYEIRQAIPTPGSERLPTMSTTGTAY